MQADYAMLGQEASTVTVPSHLLEVLRATAEREFEFACGKGAEESQPFAERLAVVKRAASMVDALEQPDSVPAAFVAHLAREQVDWDVQIAGEDHPWPHSIEEADEYYAVMRRHRDLIALRDQAEAVKGAS
jgi:hypothetical protein